MSPTSTNKSTTGFAYMPGMAVLPMWWMATTFSPSAAATCFASASNASRHRGSWGTTSTFLMNSAPQRRVAAGAGRRTARDGTLVGRASELEVSLEPHAGDHFWPLAGPEPEHVPHEARVELQFDGRGEL